MSDDAPDTPGRCPRNPDCVHPAGHRGFCRFTPLPRDPVTGAVLAAAGIDLARAKRNARARKQAARDLTGRQMTYVALVVQGLPHRDAARQAGFRDDYCRILDANPKIALAIEQAAARVASGQALHRGPGRPAKRPDPIPIAPAVIIPGATTPPAARYIDGFTATGGPVRGAVARDSDVGIQLARDLSTCTREEIEARWSPSARHDAETALDRPWSAILPLDHDPIYFLAQRCWFDNVIDDPRFLYAPYHRDLFLRPIRDYILDPAPPEAGILFLGPRFTYKSTFSHGTIAQWYVLRGAHLLATHYAVVLRHHKLELAADNLVRLKAKFQSHPWVRAVWAPACPAERVRDFGTMQRFTLPWVPPGQTADPSFRAIGLGASDTGRHPDLDLGDDLVTEEHLSKVVRDEAKRRYRAKRYQLDIQSGREVNTGTPYHRMDLWSMMMNATLDGRALYRVVTIPAHLPESMRPQFGTLAHPYKLSEENLEKRRLEELATAGNDDFYYLQFEVTYRLSRQQTTEAWWLRDYSREDVPEDGFPILVLDPAFKGDEQYGEGDSASLQVWVLVRRGSIVQRYLIDGVHSNELSTSDGEREVLRLMARYGITVFAPELAKGSAFRANVIQTAASLGQRIQVIDLKTKQRSKPDRIGAFLKECEAGRVFLCKEADPALLEEFRSQFDNWPQVDHDDALDAAAFTCDPAILDAWAPSWGSARRNFRTLRQAPPVYRTRHTTV